MAGVSHGIGWVIFLALLNWIVWSLIGIPPLWYFFCAMGKQLRLYVELTNIGLCVAFIIGWAWYGIGTAIKTALVLIGFNLIPQVTSAIFAFGHRCG